MIRATVLLALFGAASANLHDREFYEGKFIDYLREFKLEARDGGHFVDMLKKFTANHDMIERHNAETKSFKLGINAFAHMDFEEWKAHVHLGLGFPQHEPAEFTIGPALPGANAASIDWTTMGAVTGVKDQGNCGSCWSFSATGALEGAYFNKYGSLVSFSEQNLVSCDPVDSGCNGGLMDNAFQWTKQNNGICTEADYPYTSGTTGQDGSCQQNSCTKNTNVAPKSYTDVTKNNDAALETALNINPVSVAIQANQPAFQFYKSGVMDGTCGTRLDHGVLAVGYGHDNDQNLDYYKIKNSWGPSWGEDGYIRIEKGLNQRGGQCGVLMGPPSYPNL